MYRCNGPNSLQEHIDRGRILQQWRVRPPDRKHCLPGHWHRMSKCGLGLKTGTGINHMLKIHEEESFFGDTMIAAG